MVLARDRERARRRRERSRGRVVDFQGRQRLHTVRSTNQQDAPVAQQRGGVSAAGRAHGGEGGECVADRKSTRLNSSHLVISYAVFCLKKKKRRGRRAGVSDRLPCATPRRRIRL